MLGDAAKAQEVFEAIMHDAALRAAQGELPKDRLWMFGDARWRCLEVSEAGLQPEAVEMEEHEIAATAPSQIARMDPTQLAIWISGAPDPQRSALALFYLMIQIDKGPAQMFGQRVTYRGLSASHESNQKDAGSSFKL